MTDELKQLIEDAAKLLGLTPITLLLSGVVLCSDGSIVGVKFDPFDQQRGDLMKVAEAAELDVDFYFDYVATGATDGTDGQYKFTKGDYQSLALAVLRAASAVYKSRGGV